jgi:GNAT superfamily N-acetyltransferase
LSTLASSADLIVRPFRAEDEPPVLDLLTKALGGGPPGRRSPEFFRWKHRAGPFGSSYMLVGELGGRIVGLRAFMRWRLRAGGRMLSAVRAVDTATHPDHRNAGVFSRITRDALELLREDVDLVFNTPNATVLPGYLKLGWRIVGRMPVAVRVRRPIRFARGLPSFRGPIRAPRGGPPVEAEPAAQALMDGEQLSPLLGEQATDPRLSTPRDLEYLRWRYASAPGLDYRAVREDGWSGLRGIAIFRVRARGRLWESTVVELLGRPADRRTAGRLLRRVAEAAPVDHLTCSFAPGSVQARAARRCGFLRSPVGPTFVVNTLRGAVRPDPADLRSWALSLGDLEVF